jgi:hypothetical protein
VGALGVGPAQGAASPQPGHSFGGKTSQGHLITIGLNSKRDKITSIAWAWSAPCVLGSAATAMTSTEADSELSLFSAAVPINRFGAWRLEGHLLELPDPSGITDRFSGRFVGRRTGDRMVGTVQMQVIETDAAGQNVRTCTSPSIRFRLAGPNTFAGRTSQRQRPIVIKVNPARTRIDSLRWNWHGQCTLGPAARSDTTTGTYTWPDYLQGPVKIDKRGRFRAIWTVPFSDPRTGITTAWRYRLVGSRSGQDIQGALTASYAEMDTATGGLIRSCSSGPVKFHATD